MAQEGKKISFGFSKSIKKPDLKPVTQIESKNVDYIEYVDEKSIKVIGKEEKKDEPLVIPMLGSKSWHNRIINKINADIYAPSSGSAQKNGNANPTNINKKLINGEKERNSESFPGAADNTRRPKQTEAGESTESLEELAAREIINDLKQDDEEKPSVDLTIGQSNNLAGEKEPTLENYEEIPIEKFGIALLRGMGWEPEKGIGKNSKVVPVAVPNLRPRGMGLGADKAILPKKNVKPKTKEEQELKLEAGCYVRIIAGKYVNSYGQLQSFDDESGRLIIKLALGSKSVSLNEYLVEPVTKENYKRNSKILNISTYEQFNSNGNREREQNSLSTTAKAKEENGDAQGKLSTCEKNSKYREASSTSDESGDSDGKHKRKCELNDKDDYHKSKKSKKHRCHDESELSKKNTKKDKDRERTRERSRSHHSSKSSNKKKSKRRKRSHSRSLNRR